MLWSKKKTERQRKLISGITRRIFSVYFIFNEQSDDFLEFLFLLFLSFFPISLCVCAYMLFAYSHVMSVLLACLRVI